MRYLLLAFLLSALAAHPASSLDTLGAYGDVGDGPARYIQTPYSVPFDIVVVQKSEFTAGATEFSVTELALLYPGAVSYTHLTLPTILRV